MPATAVLVSRRHVDLGRLASAACRPGPCCGRRR
ncbi:putative leader peptide [Streptomyces sp. NPDC058239]